MAKLVLETWSNERVGRAPVRGVVVSANHSCLGTRMCSTSRHIRCAGLRGRCTGLKGQCAKARPEGEYWLDHLAQALGAPRIPHGSFNDSEYGSRYRRAREAQNRKLESYYHRRFKKCRRLKLTVETVG